MRGFALLLTLWLASGNALAHGGEDHGDEAPPPAAAVQAGPRATAASDDFEFVAAPQGERLLVFLDRFATNEPVQGARIEIESGAFKAVATSVSPGVYAVDGSAFKAPGRHALTVTIETDAKAGGVSDLLSATLEVAAPSTNAATRSRSGFGVQGIGGSTLAWLAAGVLALLAAIALWRRARNKPGREGASR